MPAVDRHHHNYDRQCASQAQEDCLQRLPGGAAQSAQARTERALRHWQLAASERPASESGVRQWWAHITSVICTCTCRSCNIMFAVKIEPKCLHRNPVTCGFYALLIANVNIDRVNFHKYCSYIPVQFKYILGSTNVTFVDNESYETVQRRRQMSETISAPASPASVFTDSYDVASPLQNYMYVHAVVNDVPF